MSIQKNVQGVGALLLSCALTITQSAAQETVNVIDPVQNETLANVCLQFDEALILAAQTDPAVSAARAGRSLAEADLKQAKSLTRPQISTFARTGLGDVGLVDSVIQNRVGLRASQRVFDFGDAKFARREARANLEASDYEIVQAELVSAQIAGIAYLGMLQAEEEMLAISQRRDFFERQRSAVTEALKSGAATRSERADVAAQLADAQAAFLELQFRREEALTQLEIATGVPGDICDANPVHDDLSVMMDTVGDLESAVSNTLLTNPVLRSLEARARGFDAARKREKLARLPVVDVVGIASYSSVGIDGGFAFQERVGVDVSVPLLTGNGLGARKQRARARQANARSEANIARRQLEQDVRITFLRVLSLQSQLVRRRIATEESKKQFEATELEYNAGARTLPELVENRLEYEQSELNRIQVKFELARERLRLLTLTAALPLTVEKSSKS